MERHKILGSWNYPSDMHLNYLGPLPYFSPFWISPRAHCQDQLQGLITWWHGNILCLLKWQATSFFLCSWEKVIREDPPALTELDIATTSSSTKINSAISQVPRDVTKNVSAVSLRLGYHNKTPKTGWLTQHSYFLTILEAGKSRIKVLAVQHLVRTPSWLIVGHLLPVSSHDRKTEGSLWSLFY